MINIFVCHEPYGLKVIDVESKCSPKVVARNVECTVLEGHNSTVNITSYTATPIEVIGELIAQGKVEPESVAIFMPNGDIYGYDDDGVITVGWPYGYFSWS